MKKKYFFGWINIRYGVKELIKMYSSKEDSYFSKKRIESGIAFIIGVHGWLYTLVNVVKTMQDFIMWFGTLIPFIIYSIYKIEKSKEVNKIINKQENV